MTTIKENQESICNWARDTFGGADKLISLHERAQLEMDELRDCLLAEDMSELVAGEVADVLILLYRISDEVGVNLHEAVDRKMAINRARQWVKNGDGTGRHL